MKKIIIYFLNITLVFALKIDNINFDKEVKRGKKVREVYQLKNDSSNLVVNYNLKIEGDKQVKVYPQNLILSNNESNYYTIEVTGKKRKGVYYYYLVIEEQIVRDKKRKNNVKKEIGIIKRLKIKQKYKVR